MGRWLPETGFGIVLVRLLARFISFTFYYNIFFYKSQACRSSLAIGMLRPAKSAPIFTALGIAPSISPLIKILAP